MFPFVFPAFSRELEERVRQQELVRQAARLISIELKAAGAWSRGEPFLAKAARHVVYETVDAHNPTFHVAIAAQRLAWKLQAGQAQAVAPLAMPTYDRRDREDESELPLIPVATYASVERVEHSRQGIAVTLTQLKAGGPMMLWVGYV